MNLPFTSLLFYYLPPLLRFTPMLHAACCMLTSSQSSFRVDIPLPLLYVYVSVTHWILIKSKKHWKLQSSNDRTSILWFPSRPIPFIKSQYRKPKYPILRNISRSKEEKLKSVYTTFCATYTLNFEKFCSEASPNSGFETETCVLSFRMSPLIV